MKKILVSALLIAGLAIDASAVTYAYDVAANYSGSNTTGGAYALSSPANFTKGNTSMSSNYNKGGKFYVNPGHGGFDSDDRPTPMPLIGEYFYESEGNLDRGLHMQQWLIKNGATVKMSRTVNTSAMDLNLTSIATYSSNYGGYFYSLHSNGANASANYHVALYKGVNASNSVAGSERMAYYNSYNNYNNGCLTEFTYGTPRSMADYDLMGWHYGVLRTNTQPGYLVETWFHDYRPESLRFKSSLYNKFLAWQIAVGTLTAPGGSGALPGCIVGDVRDTSKSCGYSNYTTRGRDTYLALNNVTVTCTNSSGTKVGEVSTGSKSNGVYAFFVPAGTYTLTFKKDGYKSVTKTVTVSNNKAAQNDINMSEGVDTGISLSPASTGFGETSVGNTSSKTITVTGTSLSANITISNSDNTNFSISKTSLGATGGTFNIVYKPQSAGSHSTTISFVSGSHKASMVVTGTAKNPPLTFTEGWNYSEKSGKKAAWMSAGFANYRNMAFGDGKLYIVDAPNGKINVVKAQTCEFIKELNMTGVEGGALKLVDVAFVDGKLIGTNIALSTNETMKTLKVYIWDNDDAAPRVLLETTDLGGMNRIGDAIEVQGNLTSGKLVYLAQQTRNYTDADGKAQNGNCNSIVTYALSNGTASKTPVVADIDGFVIGLSPRAIPDGNNFWVAGQAYLPSQVTANGQLTASIPLTAFNIEAAFHGCGNDFVPFTFKGNKYAFATDYQAVTKAGSSATADEIKTTTLLGGRAILIDGSAGWAVEGLKNSGNYPSAGLGSTTRNTTYSSSLCVNVNGDAGVEMWVLVHNQGIAYYKHGTAPTYTYEKVPEITAPAEVTFSTVENVAKTQTITIGGELLTGNISASLAGNASFAINKTSLGKDGGDITITYRPTAAGEHTATLTLSSAGAATKTVQLKGKAEAAIALGLTKVWQNTTSVPAADGNYRFAAVSNDKILVADKANNKILNVTSSGYNNYYDPSAVLTEYYNQTISAAIGCDDAGNILISTGWSAAASGKNYAIVSADLKSTYKIDLSTIEGYTPGRCDQLGRIRGNMLSNEGAYAFIVPHEGTSVLVVKIKNGAIDANYSQVSNTIAGVALNTSCCPQPAFETVAEIDALMDDNNDLSNAFIMRSRSVPGSVYAWNDDNSDMVKAWSFTNKSEAGHTVAHASVDGFDWFKLYGKSYFIMPMTTDGTTNTRGSIFGIYDEAGNLVACWTEGEKTGLGACFGSFIAVPNNEYSVYIYHYVPGTVAEKFTFAVEPQSDPSGVESIEAAVEETEAPVEYYNLQGVKVANPSNGIFIKKQGNKASKVYVK